MDVLPARQRLLLPEEARWSYVKARAKQDDIAVIIDTALSTIEKRINPHRCATDNYFSGC